MLQIMIKEIKPRYTAKMTPEEFTEKCRELFGDKDSVWKRNFCKVYDCPPSTVSRYLSGKVPIPGRIVNFLYCFELINYYEGNYMEDFELEGC